MEKTDKSLSKEQLAQSRQLRLEVMHLQDIEGNPLDTEDVALFERFEEEGWSHEQRLEFLRAHAKQMSTALAAE